MIWINKYFTFLNWYGNNPSTCLMEYFNPCGSEQGRNI